MSVGRDRVAAWRRTGAALALVLLAAGCAGTQDARQVSLPLPQSTPPEQSDRVPAQREHARILGSYGGIYDNARIQAMIEDIVVKLAAASDRPDLRYTVTMLNSPAINAFALPDGRVYVTRGLIALASDKAELASVLAHEMGHVLARHAAIREEQAKQAAIINTVVTDVLSDPQMGALALAKSKLTLASFSRAQEFEADSIGVGISARAGFDPFGASRFLTAMQRNADLKSGNNGDPRAVDFLSSHPATPDRVRGALLAARRFTGPGAGETSRDQYLLNIDGLIYGEDPSEGFARGRRFVHPKLGFTFTAPAGFALDNTAQAVLGVKDGGGEAMRLDIVSVPAEQTLSDYLKSGWMEGVLTVEDTVISGFPAASAMAKGKDWSFRIFAVRFGSDVYRFIFAAKTLTPHIDRTFRESVSTFRRLSLKEAEDVRPQHVAVVTAATGDTVEKLARRMAVPDRTLERFRMINGLGPNDRIKPGEKVKIVVD